MTLNEGNALANALIALSLFWLGATCIWQARERWHRWPVTALVALGGMFIGVGIVVGQPVAIRLDIEPWLLGRNAVGTLLIKLVVLCLVIALLQRVLRGSLLTAGDRARIREGPDL